MIDRNDWPGTRSSCFVLEAIEVKATATCKLHSWLWLKGRQAELNCKYRSRQSERASPELPRVTIPDRWIRHCIKNASTSCKFMPASLHPSETTRNPTNTIFIHQDSAEMADKGQMSKADSARIQSANVCCPLLLFDTTDICRPNLATIPASQLGRSPPAIGTTMQVATAAAVVRRATLAAVTRSDEAVMANGRRYCSWERVSAPATTFT